MMNSDRVKRFEDLECWKRSRELANFIYDLTLKPVLIVDNDYKLQIRRAAISVMNNIAEGFDRGTNKDFIKFLFIAKASASEVRSMLYLGLDRKYLTVEEFEMIYDITISCSQLIWGLIRFLRKSLN